MDMWESRAGAGALVTRGGRLLMVLRERSGEVRWELPSGLLEAGESFEDAAARETLEETGIPVEVGELLCTVLMVVPSESYRGINAYFHATAASDLAPHVTAQSELIREAAFLEIVELNSADIHPVDRRILERWRRNPQERGFYISLTL